MSYGLIHMSNNNQITKKKNFEKYLLNSQHCQLITCEIMLIYHTSHY